RFYVKNVNTFGSESSQFQDKGPTWTETIRTQTVADGSESPQFQDISPTWTKTIRTPTWVNP
ncbi:MAG: hypothetical protein ACXWFZ_03145, partial [Nitrososphaeraceae archaeon]